MADIDELYEKAKVKLEAESFQHGTPEDAIRSMCLEWLEWAVAHDTKAVELLADAAKDTEGAYKAMENFRECLKRVNSKEIYNHFLNSGFNVIIRDDERTIEETLALVERSFNMNYVGEESGQEMIYDM